MVQESPQIAQLKQQLRDSLQREPLVGRTITIAKRAHIYRCDDPAETVYCIERGQVKLLMISPEGRECILAIHSAGDIFGELCLSGLSVRVQTAIAMEETVLKQIPYFDFLALLSRDGIIESFVQYLTARIADQQQAIANLVTVDSEQRLGKTLLQLARKLGKKDPRNIRICKDTDGVYIEHKISHEELSEMVGTTRPRISAFMQRFRHLGLVETSGDRFLLIKENKLSAYLSQIS